MQNKKKKIIALSVGIVLTVVIGLIAYWLIHYYFHNEYRDVLSSYEYEEGTEYSPIKESTSSVEGMELAAENDTLKLYVNAETGDVAIYDKRNEQITYSNPIGADEDGIANVTNKNYLKSQLIIEYFNSSRTQGTMDSYSYCTSLGQLEVEAIENGIRFIYYIGDLSSKTGVVPQYISKEALDAVIAALPEDEAKFVSKKYKESTIAENYYELLESAVSGASQLRKLNTYFENAGFTEEDYNREMEGSGVEGIIPISFTVPVEYRLNEDAVDVSIPMSAVQENGGGSIYRIQLLRYFGAAGLEEEGYMLVPNGSGSLIYFNNGKTTAENYSEYVYGIDPLMAEYTVRENTQDSTMALYGIFRDSSSIFATIEDGASYAYLTASVSGKINEYNYVYPTFVVRGNDKLAMFGTTGNEADIPIVEKNYYDANITVKYTMLTEENSGYAGAANYYRERLIKEGVLTAQEATTEDIKFYYDILGGVQMTKYFLGTQYEGLYVMTSFEEAGQIYQDLADNGITNQVMNFQGWMNGGYYHDVVDQIRIPLSMGGKGDLEDLSALLSENGSSFYADTAFQHVTYISSRYSEGDETSRYYGGGYIAEFGLVNPATLRQTSGLGYAENYYYLLSPKFLGRYVDEFVDSMEKYEISGISLRDLGNELHSDKKRTNVITREEALDVVLDSLTKLEGTEKNILLNAANDYAFGYADDIINAPLSANDYFIVDETVPFYSMLIHGCIDYSGTVINLSDTVDRTEIVLNLLETGAAPHFVFTWENSSDIKNTALNRYYATTYEHWKEDALSIYEEVNAVLKNVNGASIVNHQILDNDVRVVTYSNGVIIYINNSETEQVVDGVSVPAKGYGIGGTK